MSNSFFQFKQFTVWHDKCAMKVGTDGVLLGAWTSVCNARRILDVGAGTGLVALMLTQRSMSDTTIVAIEIDKAAAEQARENVIRSPWKDRITVLQADFKQYETGEKFDVIVSNPPYFVDSLNCPNRKRNAARHNNSLTYDELFQGVTKMLSEKGEFTIITPTELSERIKVLAKTYHLHANHQLNVITKPGGSFKRTLLTFSFIEKLFKKEILITELARHEYSEEYIALTREYYLRM